TEIRARDGNGKSSKGRMQKVIKSGNFYCGFAGMAKDDITGFDVIGLFNKAVNAGGNFIDIINRFQNIVLEPLARAWEGIKRDDPTKYDEKVSGGDSVILQIVVGTIENAIPKLTAIDFAATPGEKGPRPIKPFPTNCPGDCPGEFQIVALGEFDAIAKYDTTNPTFKIKNAPLRVACFFIGLEADARKDKVGFPVDIVRITSKGAEWIQIKNKCPDIQPYTAPEQRKKPTRKSKRRG
ncbi:MAG: hypothetical protein ACJ74G_17050, partial [Blastocatellia bacterium]